jgi:hypothetical protein
MTILKPAILPLCTKGVYIKFMYTRTPLQFVIPIHV